MLVVEGASLWRGLFNFYHLVIVLNLLPPRKLM